MEDGWQIPGLAAMLASHPQKEDTLANGTGSIRVEVFIVSSPKRLGAFRALFLSRKDDVDYVMWQMIRPKTVFAYSISGKRFAVMVEGVFELGPDPKTGQGGTGPEVRLYFQDPDGITLEFACWTKEFTDQDSKTAPKTAADRRPRVPAGR